MEKRIITILLTLVMVVNLFPVQVQAQQVDTQSMLSLGDYVNFGSNGDALKWRVVNVEDNLVTLFCESSFSGEFDASIHQKTVTYSLMKYVTYGSATWEYSDVRTWLNARTDSVIYPDISFDYSKVSTGGIASILGNDDSKPSYSSWDGFLSDGHFNDKEYFLIEPTKRVSLIPTTQSGHKFVYAFKNFDNLDSYYDGSYGISKTVDRVFLLNTLEVKKYIVDHKFSSYNDRYWLRDSVANQLAGYYFYWGTNAATIYNGNPDCSTANSKNNIRPACCINIDYLMGVSGEGTKSDPYDLEIDPNVVGRKFESDAPDSIKFCSLRKEALAVYVNEKNASQIIDSYKLLRNVCASDSVDNVESYDESNLKVKTLSSGFLVSADGYAEVSMTADQFKAMDKKFYLEKISDDIPTITAVWIGNIDVRHKSYSIDLLSKNSVTLSANVIWPDNITGTIQLVQGSKTVNFNEGTATIVLSDYFDTSQKIYIVATSVDGKTTKKTLKLVNTSDNKMKDIKLDWGDGCSFSLPDGIPGVGGAKLGVDIYSNMPISYSIENNKVYIAIGFQNGTKWKNGDKQVKSFTESIKELKKLKADSKEAKQKFENLKKEKGYFGKGKGSFGADVNFDMMGFAEAYITQSGALQFLDGGIVIGGEGSLSGSQPFVILGLPAYFGWKIEADLQEQINLLFNEKAKTFIPSGALEGSLAISGDANLGIKALFSGGGGVKGAATLLWQQKQGEKDYVKVTGTANAYCQFSIFGQKQKKDFPPFYNKVWYESNAAALNSTENKNTTVLYNEKEFGLPTEDEMTNQLRFSANQPATLAMSEVENDLLVSSPFAKEVYEQAEPKISVFEDGSLIAVWKGLDNTRNTYDRTCLYYSVCRTGIWSEPKMVDDDGTADYYPNLLVVNDIAYLSWTNMSEKEGDSPTLTDIGKKMEIAVAIFAKDEDKWTKTTLTDNKRLDVYPIVCGNGGDVAVVWQTNEEGDVFGENGKNGISVALLNQGEWTVSDLHSNISNIINLSADYSGGELNIAWSQDMDCDLTTQDDIEIYVNGKRITNNYELDSGITYYDGDLYWYHDGELYMNGKDTGVPILSDRFQIINDTLLYSKSKGMYSVLVAHYKNAESWSNPVELTNGDEFIPSFSAVSVDGILKILAEEQTVERDVDSETPAYGSASISLLEQKSIIDLSLEEVSYQEEYYLEGNTFPIYTTLCNKGTEMICGAVFTITDSENKTLSTSVYTSNILPGDCVEITLPYELPLGVLPQDVTITVCPMRGSDVDLSNNHKELFLNCDLLKVENISESLNAQEEKVVCANIVNRSYDDKNNIIVKLYKDALNQEVVETQIISNLKSMEAEPVSFIVNGEAKCYYITATCGDQQDEDYVVALNNTTSWIELESFKDNSVSVIFNESIPSKAVLFLAAYNQQGKQVSSGSQELHAGEENATIHMSEKIEENAIIKAFLVKNTQEMKPIKESIILK